MNKLILLGLATLICFSNIQALAQEQSLPIWLKNTATLWGQDKMSDKEFFDLLQYLADADIITIPQSESNVNFRETIGPQSSHALTYMIADIPQKFDKQVIHDGIYDGLNSWAEINSQFVFKQITVGEPDIMITWMQYDEEEELVSRGCVDCIQEGATIELVLALDDCNGIQVQIDRESIRNHVAHIFGLNIGLEQHSDITHLMYSDGAIIKPYNDQGYNIPTLIEPFIIGEKLYISKLTRIDSAYDTLKIQQDIMYAQYNARAIQFDNLHEQYENNRVSEDAYDAAYNNLELERKKLNEHIDLTNSILEEYEQMDLKLDCIQQAYYSDES